MPNILPDGKKRKILSTMNQLKVTAHSSNDLSQLLYENQVNAAKRDFFSLRDPHFLLKEKF